MVSSFLYPLNMNDTNKQWPCLLGVTGSRLEKPGLQPQNDQTWPTKKSQVALFHSIKPLFRNRPLLIILNKLLGMTLDLSEELRSLDSGFCTRNACLCDRFDLYEWKRVEDVKPATNIREVLICTPKWLYIYDAILSHISSLPKKTLKLSLSI